MTPLVQNINDVDFVASLIRRYGADVLKTLLKDRTTGNNIIWADREYEQLGDGYAPYDEITIPKISDRRVIEPRVVKSKDQQAWRTRESAEVFTPSWLCKQMVDCMDDAFFGEDPAGFEGGAETGLTKTRMEKLAEKDLWKSYVDNRLLEITCGEAPFVCSPYDATTGDFVPVDERVGFLDRKLRVVKRFTETYEDWFRWAKRALMSSYGYEYQGDNLLIARINTFNTFAGYLQDAWSKDLDEAEAKKIALVISWNLWQMDGLRDCVPSKWDVPQQESMQLSFYDLGFFTDGESSETEGEEQELSEVAQLCEIKDWRSNKKQTFAPLKGQVDSMKKFFGVIGNPPYQQETEGTSNTALPIYNHFMEESFAISERVELITPARFLFNAGRTPKEWNQGRLHDTHFKVLHYENDGSIVFPNTDIKGGVAISYRDTTIDFGEIGVFTPFPEMKRVLEKLEPFLSEHGVLQSITYVANKFDLNEAVKAYPDMMGRERRMSSNVLELPIFTDTPSSTDDVAILGLEKSKRTKKYIARKYVDLASGNLSGYKVVLPKAIGSGAFGETLSGPELEGPYEGYTHTFMGLGNLQTKEAGEALLKYVKSKFARAMLGLLKVTQDNTLDKWAKVPLQDFTSTSDIDWSKSIAEIDQQLYKKYGLSKEEIAFIETHVKEMS